MEVGRMILLPEIRIQGVKVNPITKDELNLYIGQLSMAGNKALVLNVNVHALNLAHRDSDFRRLLNHAEIVFCDGAGVMLAAKLLGHHIPERITYADWTWDLAEYAEQHDLSLFLLGAKPGVAIKAGESLQRRFTKLKIVGIHHGYFDRTSGSAENEAVIRQINQARPNILLTGFGMPIQEHWLAANWSRLEANVALTGGAVFDYLSGDLRRGPKWMTDNGLEWAARLMIEPQRLWKRYIVGNPIFLWRIICERFGLRS
jgi:N-acetylglucosaminyldiphosphoundecaprenol N-acetyl-beta-D-mannosaminyltransferase